MEFGNRLRLLREEKNISRKQIACFLKISYSSIAKYEANERFPDKNTLIALSKFFNVSIDYLLGITDIREPIEKIIKKGVVAIKPSSDIEKLYKSLSASKKKQFKDFGEFLKNI